eukprot:m.1212463 g.1212463  ORF g.1212463 m.1212463 type:complete len:61 (+) comp24598_c0_seq5:2854-3036(+)
MCRDYACVECVLTDGAYCVAYNASIAHCRQDPMTPYTEAAAKVFDLNPVDSNDMADIDHV